MPTRWIPAVDVAAPPISKRRFPLYLIPILIGLAGLLFSNQLENIELRSLVIVLSLAVPLIACGHLLAKPRMHWLTRTALFGGVLLLLLGAAATVTGLGDQLVNEEYLPQFSPVALRLVGLLSLMLGLIVVLYSVVRSRQDVEEYAERFWHLAEHINEGFVLATLEGTIVLVNSRFLQMFDFAEPEILGRTVEELGQRLNAQVFLPTAGALSPSTEYELDYIVRGETRRFWFSGQVLRDRAGRVTGALATVRDITESHRLAQRVERYAHGLQQLVEEQTHKLRASEEQLRQLLLSMREGFVTLDHAYRVQFANRHIRALLGRDESELLGREIFEFVDATGRIGLLNLLSKGADIARAEARRELNLVAGDGSLVPVLVGIAYVGEGEAADSRHSLVITSVRELKAMQQELEARARALEELNVELRQHDKAKDAFLSNVSHELRTPLSTIHGYLEMLESGGLGDITSAQAGAVQVMHRNVRRLMGHINEIIEFSRMEIRGVQLDIDLLNPEQIARDALASALPAAQAKQLHLALECEPGLSVAWGDSEKLGQVLGVLLNNAVKFTDRGGSVTLRVLRRQPASLCFAVSDTGIGIEPLYHDSVFKKFFQVDSSRARRYEGTGIGLSIARGIATAHGGDVELESRPGHGSKFTVVLPEAFYQPPMSPRAHRVFHGCRLLIVDPTGLWEAALRPALEAAGAEVAVQPRVHLALAEAREHKPDIVLLNEARHVTSTEAPIDRLIGQLREAGLAVVLNTFRPLGEPLHGTHEEEGLAQLTKPHRANDFMAACERAVGPAWEMVPQEPPAYPAPRPPHVLVIDSDPGLLEWVERGLRLRGVPCWCSPTVARAIEIAKSANPDAVLFDVDLPAGQVRERLAALRAAPELAGCRLYPMSGLPQESVGWNGRHETLAKPFTLDALIALVSYVPAEVAQKEAVS